MRVPAYTFATFVTASPSSKLATVSSKKNAAEYDPRTDWWKRLREGIPRNHRDGGSPDDLRRLVEAVTERKKTSYADRVDAYVEWWGAQTIRPVSSTALTWTAGTLEVSISPELVVSVDGVKHVIKLYLNGSDRLTTDRANVVLRLMELTYRAGASPTGKPVVGVLDLAQRHFHTPATSLAYLDPLLLGEAASFTTIWGAIP